MPQNELRPTSPDKLAGWARLISQLAERLDGIAQEPRLRGSEFAHDRSELRNITLAFRGVAGSIVDEAGRIGNGQPPNRERIDRRTVIVAGLAALAGSVLDGVSGELGKDLYDGVKRHVAEAETYPQSVDLEQSLQFDAAQVQVVPGTGEIELEPDAMADPDPVIVTTATAASAQGSGSAYDAEVESAGGNEGAGSTYDAAGAGADPTWVDRAPNRRGHRIYMQREHWEMIESRWRAVGLFVSSTDDELGLGRPAVPDGHGPVFWGDQNERSLVNLECGLRLVVENFDASVPYIDRIAADSTSADGSTLSKDDYRQMFDEFARTVGV